jgi:hypothetical protein
VVTFRFYVVSTVAFFLALAVGVVVGSVLDGRIADSLQDRLGNVERSLDETVALMDDKNVEIDEMQRYIESSAPFAVQGRLEDSATLVVAESGLDAAAIEDLVRRLRESGSRVEGIVWLEQRWDLDDPADREAVDALLAESTDGADAAELRSALWNELLEGATPTVPDAVGSTSGTTAPDATTGSTETTVPDDAATTVPDGAETPPTEAPPTTAPVTTTTVVERSPLLFEASTLRELADAGLVRLQQLDGGAEGDATSLQLVAVTGPTSTLARPGDRAIELVRTAADSGVPSVLAEVPAPVDDGEQVERGTIIARALDSSPVRFSTVDDLDLVAGRVATALALADLQRSTPVIGRYGYGPDVDGILPPWQGP